ncbi:amino acid ABC transporter permease [Bifidobacterium breve]|uniref:amino acid ABC transporter permease n=1 Tax=Bifidobacterium breve TaxID=1685 RepID=UPI00080B7E34|nr:amino acid ABC transporter permease [Bifidobacterium breve]
MTLDYEFMGQDIPVLLRALPATITLTLWSMLVALLFAVACGAFILVRIPVLKQLVIVINTFIKGVPLVIQLLFCYYAVPIVAKGLGGFLGYHFDPRNPPYFPAAVLALGLNFGAYITDVVVSSVRAIDHGQIEAGKACGMRRREIIWHILLPQVVVVSIPDMDNYYIWLLKGTSVASLVGVAELLGTAKISASQNYDFLEAYLVAALLYWVVCVVAEWLLNLLYARLGKFNIKEDDAMQQFSFFFLNKQAKSKLRRKVSVIA